MSKKILLNKYILNYVPRDLRWYKRDGLMTYIDQLKHKRFKENRDKHFKNAEIVNFDIINHRCRGDPLQNSEKYYKTITKKDFKHYPNEEKNLLSMLLRELQAPISGFKEI